MGALPWPVPTLLVVLHCYSRETQASLLQVCSVLSGLQLRKAKYPDSNPVTPMSCCMSEEVHPPVQDLLPLRHVDGARRPHPLRRAGGVLGPLPLRPVGEARGQLPLQAVGGAHGQLPLRVVDGARGQLPLRAVGGGDSFPCLTVSWPGVAMFV